MKPGDIVLIVAAEGVALPLRRHVLARVMFVPRDLGAPLQVMDTGYRVRSVWASDLSADVPARQAARARECIQVYLEAEQRPRPTLVLAVPEPASLQKVPRPPVPPSTGPVGRPDSSPGSPDHAQEPMVLALGFTSDPTPLLMRYCSGPSEHERMLRALRRRHPRYYEVLSQNLQGERLTAIAARMGTSPANARKMKQRALEFCREYAFTHTYQSWAS